MKKLQEFNDFKKGIIDGMPICLGYLSVSFAFGIFVMNQGVGFSWLHALLISMTNVTSAGQLAGVPIIAAGGTFLELAVSQLVINLRYALMSVSLSQKMGPSVRMIDRFLISFINTDEVFAVATSRKEMLGRKYMYGLILMPYLGWSSGTLLGAVAGNFLPEIVVTSLGLAIYGMFTAIVVPKTKENKMTALCVITAVVLSLIFNFVPVLKGIGDGFIIIICSVVASALFAALAPIRQEGTANE